MLREDGILAATTEFESARSRSRGRIEKEEDPAERAKDYVRRHWKYEEPAPRPADLMERVRSHSLCISGMAFQDAWNIDLERLKRCCVHVVTPGKKIVPFCAYYLTSSSGRRL